MLLVDGHNSHYTKGFLDYARRNHIHVLCYPAHSTHVYQGLNVVIFGPLKHYWTQEWDAFESSRRQKVTKENFISVYGRAHRKALTADTIKAAFKKTGVWPWNPDVITEKMMAPSLETSLEGRLPLPQPSPVRAISLAMSRYHKFTTNDTNEVSNTTTDCAVTGSSNRPTWHSVAKDTVESLASTSASFLVDEGPLTSSHQLPEYILPPQTPTRKRQHTLLEDKPENEKEEAYQDALQEAYARETRYKSALVGMQSTMVLQSMFCERLSGQLATQEEKQKKKRKKGQLNGDGLPRLLTSDEFYDRVVQHENACEEEDAARESRRKRREERAALMVTWQEAENERRKRNEGRKQAYREELRSWEEERERAKVERRRVQWNRPKQGKLEPPIPKPAVTGEDAGGDGGKNDNEADEGIVSDGGSVVD